MSRLPSRSLGATSLFLIILFLVGCGAEFPAELLPDLNPAPTPVEPDIQEETEPNATETDPEEDILPDSTSDDVESPAEVDDGSIQGRLAIIDNNGRLITTDAEGDNINHQSRSYGL